MRVLIFGGTGFSGSHLVEHCLSAGDEVFFTGRRSRRDDLPMAAARFLPCDTRNRAEVDEAFTRARPERVYQLAGQSSVARSFEDEEEVYQINVLGTLTVLQGARRLAPDARILVVGSSEEYGIPEHLPIHEEAPVRPISPYGVSRAAASLMALREAAAGRHVLVTRTFNLIGPRQSRAFACADFAAQIAEGLAAGAQSLELVTGNLDAARDFSAVAEGVRAYRHLLEEGPPGAVTNVCSGQARTVREVLEELGRLAGIKLQTRLDPARIRPTEIPEVRGDPGKLQHTTRFQPQPGAFESALRELLAEAQQRLQQRP